MRLKNSVSRATCQQQVQGSNLLLLWITEVSHIYDAQTLKINRICISNHGYISCQALNCSLGGILLMNSLLFIYIQLIYYY